jgi:hypothetical protein
MHGWSQPYMVQMSALAFLTGELLSADILAALVDYERLMRNAGSWTNMQTPSRYVERSTVVNERIRLDY